MAISSKYPATRPSLSLDFANVGRLDPRVTFARASTATYYDGVTTAKAEENLLLQSQDFTTSWTNPGTTDTANTEVAPDGTTTADTITEDLTSGGHTVNQAATFIASTPYTASVFLKAGTNNYAGIIIRTNTSSDYHGVVCDLSTGTITQTNTVDFTSASSSITSVGNGWYRVVITATSPSSISGGNLNIYMADSATPASLSNGIPSYTGTGSTIYAWGAQLEQRSAVTAYTATTTEPITNYVPVLLTAQNDVPRFDHTPTTGAALGLEIEEQRTNLLVRSEDFSTSWSNTRSSEQTNVIISPDGTLTGDKFIANTDNDTHIIAQTVSGTTNTNPYTFSVYIKGGEYSSVLMRMVEGSPFTRATQVVFDASSGTFSSLSDSGGASASSASITAVGNGWYRCSLTTTLGGSAGSIVNQIFLVSGVSSSFAGNDFNGIFLWGAQLEEGAFPTSYIATTTTALTRSADAASMTGTNFSDWYRADEGTLYSEASTYDVSTVKIGFSITDGGTSNRIQNSHGANPKLFIATGGVTQLNSNIASVTFTNNVPSKVILGYANNDGNGAANGTAGTTDTSLTVPTVTQANIGNLTPTNSVLNGHIRKIAYYPARLSDAQLQALTA